MPPRRTPAREYESLQDAATRTGFSHSTFRDLVADGTLAAYRISDKPGAGIRVKIADVNALLRPYLPEVVRA